VDDEIADRLGIRVKTVNGHCERLMRKLDVHTRAGLLAHGRRLGLGGVGPDETGNSPEPTRPD